MAQQNQQLKEDAADKLPASAHARASRALTKKKTAIRHPWWIDRFDEFQDYCDVYQNVDRTSAHRVADRVVQKAYRLKLYPTATQAQRLARHAGSCRWLWNHLLDLQKKTYAETGKFVFRFEMQKLLPGLKAEHEWLGEAPGHSLQRVCRNLETALKRSFKAGAGFPRFKAKGIAREAFYVSNESVSVGQRAVRLPKLGPVKYRSGRKVEGKIMSATVVSDGDAWWCVVQCEVAIANVLPAGDAVIGMDLGLKDLAVLSDGTRVAAPRRLRKAQRRLRRAQRALARRTKGSANRAKARAAVRRIHRKVANHRADHAHKLTAALVKRAAAVVTETPSIRGMSRGRLAKSFADAGWGEVLRQVRYKTDWAGVQHVEADRTFASTQICSSCGERRHGEHKLRLHHRTYRCSACGLVEDRDLNAALNLRRLGLEALVARQPILLNDVGVANLPERADPPEDQADACGDPSAGPMAQAVGRYGSRKQEPESTMDDG